MKSVQLFVVPLVLAMFVSTGFAQETETRSEQDFSKQAKMLHGEWQGDKEKTAEAIKGMEGLDDAMMEMILAQVKEITVNFGDGTYNVTIGPMEMAGKWKVTADESKDDDHKIKIFCEPNEDVQGQEDKNFEIHFMGDTHVKMTDLDDGGPPIVLVRKTDDDKEEDG